MSRWSLSILVILPPRGNVIDAKWSAAPSMNVWSEALERESKSDENFVDAPFLPWMLITHGPVSFFLPSCLFVASLPLSGWKRTGAKNRGEAGGAKTGARWGNLEPLDTRDELRDLFMT